MTLSLPKAPLCSQLKCLLDSIDDLDYEVIKLDLNYRKIKSDEEVELLCKIIRKLPNLKTIDLRYNNIHDEHLVGLFDALPLTLEEIDLSYNEITTDDGVRFILQQVHRFKRLHSLHLHDYNISAYYNELDFHPNLCFLYTLNGGGRRTVQRFLRTELMPCNQIICRYRLKLRKFIWLVAKKKIDEFLLIELFHKLK